MTKCINILNVVPALDVGGIEIMLYNYYCNIDRDKVKFDFIVYGPNIGIIEKKFIELGCNVYHVTPKKEGFLRYYKEITKVINNKKYDIVHAHQGLMSFIPLYVAKKYRINVRIAHAHGNNSNVGIINKIIDRVFSSLVNKFANYYFSCGLEAGQWVFGKAKVNNGEVIIVNNAIDLNKFQYKKEWREKIRKRMGLDNKYVIAQIGRISYEKNHTYTIDVFKEINKISKNVELIFIGDGELKENIEKKVFENNLKDYVRFLGNCLDVNEILSAVDILLLPSLHEGLPLTPIEAQATGLKCIISSRVSKEIKITQLVEFLDIDDSPVVWAKKIMNSFSESDRESRQEEVSQAGYNIKQVANDLQEKYIEIYNIKQTKKN